MKNMWYRYFWSEVGKRIADPSSPGAPAPAGMPANLLSVLSDTRPLPSTESVAKPLLGELLPDRRNRYIYRLAWDILHREGFSRPLRLEPWPGVDLLVPFFRRQVCVLPQSFSSRIPARERALSVVGRSLACSLEGYSLVTVLGRWDGDTLGILSAGGACCCSLDRLMEALDRTG